MHTVDDETTWYYTGPERRRASKPRRAHTDRRYRLRNESLISDFRLGISRRQEDEDGFIEISGLANGNNRAEPKSG